MASTDLATLTGQKSSVLSGISNAEEAIRGLNADLERLKEAASQLTESIAEVEEVNQKANNKEINEQIWKGKEKDGFDHHYNYYLDEAKKYKDNVEKVKEEIDQAIESTKSSIHGRQAGLDNLETILSRLENDIEKARKE